MVLWCIFKASVHFCASVQSCAWTLFLWSHKPLSHKLLVTINKITESGFQVCKIGEITQIKIEYSLYHNDTLHRPNQSKKLCLFVLFVLFCLSDTHQKCEEENKKSLRFIYCKNGVSFLNTLRKKGSQCVCKKGSFQRSEMICPCRKIISLDTISWDIMWRAQFKIMI